MSDERNRTINKEALSKGLMGTKPLFISDTSANTDIDAYAIYALTDATFTTLNAVYEGDDLSAATLPAGHIWYIPIVGTVTLAGGSVIIYQNKTSGN